MLHLYGTIALGRPAPSAEAVRAPGTPTKKCSAQSTSLNSDSLKAILASRSRSRGLVSGRMDGACTCHITLDARWLSSVILGQARPDFPIVVKANGDDSDRRKQRGVLCTQQLHLGLLRDRPHGLRVGGPQPRPRDSIVNKLSWPHARPPRAAFLNPVTASWRAAATARIGQRVRLKRGARTFRPIRGVTSISVASSARVRCALIPQGRHDGQTWWTPRLGAQR